MTAVGRGARRRGTGGSRVALCVLAVALGAIAAPAAEIAVGPGGTPAAPPFGPGESMTFDLKWGFISGGQAVMAIPEIVVERGSPCYRIVSLAESNAFVSAFFPVRDVAESHLDVRELVTLKFEKRLREGNFRSHDLVFFDHDRHIAYYPDRGRIVPISLDAQDILSSLYFVRMMDLEVGKSVSIENHADKKNYPLEIRVLRRERVSVPAGRFDCIVVEPIMRTTGIFRHEGTLKVWLTDDELHLPVLMRSKVFVGSISAELTEYRLSNDAERR